MRSLPDLKDEWIIRDGKMVAEGDSMSINTLLVDLERVADKDGGWTILSGITRLASFGNSATRRVKCTVAVQGG